MAGREITQKVIDFEFSRIQMKDQLQHNLFQEKLENTRFSEWNLQSILHSLGFFNKSQYQLKWIGYDQGSYLDAFIYCLFKGCRNSVASQNGLFIKLKYNIYQLAAKFLKINDQKQIVQTLCSAQYAKSLPSFLNKNRTLYILFDKLLKSYLQSQRIQYQSELEDLKIFTKMFNFIKLELLSESIALIQHFSEKFYIIYEKGCYFVLEAQPEKKSLIKLKKIQENDNENQYEANHSNQVLPHFVYEQKNGKQEPKKLFQYAAPKFIINNGLGKNKKKRQPRYTQVELQQDLTAQFKNHESSKIKTIDPSIISRQQIVNDKDYDHNKMPTVSSWNNENPENKSKSQSKQKIRQHRMYYKQSTKRGKTGVIETNSQKKDRSAPKSSHDITFDQKQARKNSLKKIQLNLKKLTQTKNKSNHNLKTFHGQNGRVEGYKTQAAISPYSTSPAIISSSNSRQKIAFMRYNGGS